MKKEEEKERSANAKGIVPAHSGRCSMLTQRVCRPVKEERRGKLDDKGTDEISHHQRPAHKTSTDTKQTRVSTQHEQPGAPARISACQCCKRTSLQRTSPDPTDVEMNAGARPRTPARVEQTVPFTLDPRSADQQVSTAPGQDTDQMETLKRSSGMAVSCR